MKHRFSCVVSALLLCLLCGCGKTAAAGPAGTEPSAPAQVQDAASASCGAQDTEPSAPAPSAPAEAPTVPETEAPPRTFTEADFHFYLGAEGAPVEGLINVAFYPDSRDASGAPDPDIRVWDSWRITNARERRDICERILASDLYDLELYGRTLDSMLVEWRAHNALNAVYDNERTRHVDFNRADEGLTYEDYWQRAVRDFFGS